MMNVLLRQVALGLVFQAAVITAIAGGILLLRLFAGSEGASNAWLRGTGLALQMQGVALLGLSVWRRYEAPDWAQPTGRYVGVGVLLLGSFLQLLTLAR